MEEKQGDMEGQVCVVTGSSGGIGFETARGLAKKGAEVVIVGHHRGRGEGAVARIREEYPAAAVDFVLADLSRLDEVRRLAGSLQAQYERLDVLVNNAGGFFLRRRETADGLEMTLALNYLAPFLLTNLLLARLQASAPARIVNVSSAMHENGSIHWGDLQLEQGYNGMKAYGQSKLALLLFTYELARRLEGSGVMANALHPGFVATNIGQQQPLVRPFMRILYFFVAKSPEEGAETPIYLASSPEVEGVSGQYFVDKKPVASSEASHDREAARRLWETSERLTELAPRA
jgi:retinol dehydrogenase-14